jgi:hypothetical protein
MAQGHGYHCKKIEHAAVQHGISPSSTAEHVAAALVARGVAFNRADFAHVTVGLCTLNQVDP